MKKVLAFLLLFAALFLSACTRYENVKLDEDENGFYWLYQEKKYYEDCLWVVYKNYLETRLKELTESYDDEIDNIKKKEIRDELISVSSKLKNKKVEEL